MIDAALTPLSPEDARILALESGPIRGHTLKVLIADNSPGERVVDDLRSEMILRLPRAVRWRQRLVSAPGTSSGVAWQEDPNFEITKHVRAVSDQGPIDEKQLQRLIADIMMVPLDRNRPLWTVDVLPHLTHGRWAIIWKVHHSLADGMAMMRAGSSLIWSEETGQVRDIRASRPPATSAPKKILRGARLAALIGYRGLVLREFHRVRRLSPLAMDVGPDRSVAFTQCTLEELRAIGKAIAPEVTINDVLLALIAGALRLWLKEQHDKRAKMKVQVPVSLHPHLGDGDPFGNRDSFLFIDLPLAQEDPVARVRDVSRATRLRKNRHDANAIFAIRELLGNAPVGMRESLQKFMQGPHEYSLNVSNVPGPAGPIHVLGRRVSSMYSFAEIAPHHALRVAALSLDGKLSIGLCADPNVVLDLDMLADGIRRSVEELRDATEHASPQRPMKRAA